MKFRISIFFFSLIVFQSNLLIAQNPVFKTSIPVEELRQDYEILKAVLNSYHPGLYRYQDSASIENHFMALEKKLNRDMSTREFYIVLSEFSAKLKCGHTYCNFYNQKKEIQDSLFRQNDKLPFTFSLFEKQMIIDKNLSQMPLNEGDNVISINDIPLSGIIDTLLLYVKGDGGNDGKRLIDLQLIGLGKYEAFDIYFPLLFPPDNSSYKLKVQSIDKEEIKTITVKCISRAERFALMESKYGKQPSNDDELWTFKILNENTAYLKMGTFVTRNLSFDYKSFLSDAFEKIKSGNLSNLIIDIRGNEGGDDEVNLELATHLASKDIELPRFKELLRYEKVSDELRPYLKTWDKGFYDRSGQVNDLGNGFYTRKKDRQSASIKQNKNAYSGKVYLLVNAANSSATFFLATTLQQNKIATIIGTETGGNRKGTNGGNLFFLRLPNSALEIDIPLIGYYPLKEEPDQGLLPDVLIIPDMEDILNKNDLEMARALELINEP